MDWCRRRAVIAAGHDLIEQARSVDTRMVRHEPSLQQDAQISSDTAL